MLPIRCLVSWELRYHSAVNVPSFPKIMQHFSATTRLLVCCFRLTNSDSTGHCTLNKYFYENNGRLQDFSCAICFCFLLFLIETKSIHTFPPSPGAQLSTRAPRARPVCQSLLKLVIGSSGSLFWIHPSSLCLGVFCLPSSASSSSSHMGMEME